MPAIRTILTGAAAALALTAVPAQAQLGAYGADNSRIERKPEQPKPPEPIERKDFDEAVGELFRLGDTDRDGTITLAEFNAAIEARKAAAIARRFAEIDSDRSQSISPAEFAAWQRGMGSAVLSDAASAGAAIDRLVGEELAVDLGNKEEERRLAELVAPLGATALVSANTDYDGGVTLPELLAWEGKRFDEADVNDDGWVTFFESEAFFKRGPGHGPG